MEVATKEKNSKHKPSPNTGKVAALADERGKREQKRKKRFLQNSKYLPVILERRKNAVGNTRIKKYGVE